MVALSVLVKPYSNTRVFFKSKKWYSVTVLILLLGRIALAFKFGIRVFRKFVLTQRDSEFVLISGIKTN